MSRIAYVNGRYVPHRQAHVHIEDRGFQFSDGVYEVFPVFEGRMANSAWHLERLNRSLAELRISWPLSANILPYILQQIVVRNRVQFGLVYLQITRGVAPRNHTFPHTPVAPSLVITARSLDISSRNALAQDGVGVRTMPDTRWERRDIKSVSLLANLLAKQSAAEAGAYEAVLLDDDGFITEGSSSTFWIIDADGTVVTRPLSSDILPGVTRRVILELAPALGMKVEERKFDLSEALSAREAFITSATSFVMPVTLIDDQIIANGAPGMATTALRAAYITKLRETP